MLLTNRLTLARQILKKCRAGNPLGVKSLLELIIVYGVSYEKLRTSRKEVLRFLHQHDVWWAQFHLDMCRKGQFMPHLGLLKTLILHGRVSCHELGIDSEYLRDLNRREEVIELLRDLESARRNGRGLFVGRIKQYVDSGVVSYAELGTSEQEVEQLVRAHDTVKPTA